MDDLTKRLTDREVERHRQRAIKSLERVKENVEYALRSLRDGADISGYTRNVAELGRNAHESVIAMDAARDLLALVQDGEGNGTS